MLAWLESTRPDAVALQETRSTEADFPRAAIEAAGYGCLSHGQKTWNGVALLARDADPVPIRRGLPGEPDPQARYLEAAIDGVIVATLYLPNGNPWPGPKFDYKLAWFDRLIEHAASHWKTGHPVVLAGDFNVVPTDDDIYSPASWLDNALLQPEARQAYARLLEHGWTDALRKVHPKDPYLHLLGLPPQPLAARRRPAHRPPAAEQGAATEADRRRRRPRPARRRGRERSRAGVG